MLLPTYPTHPEAKPANQRDTAGQVVEVIGTSRTASGTRAGVVLVYWKMRGVGPAGADRDMVTADHEHGQRDFAGVARSAAVRWLKKVLADESNDARFYE